MWSYGWEVEWGGRTDSQENKGQRVPAGQGACELRRGAYTRRNPLPLLCPTKERDQEVNITRLRKAGEASQEILQQVLVFS